MSIIVTSKLPEDINPFPMLMIAQSGLVILAAEENRNGTLKGTVVEAIDADDENYHHVGYYSDSWVGFATVPVGTSITLTQGA